MKKELKVLNYIFLICLIVTSEVILYKLSKGVSRNQFILILSLILVYFCSNIFNVIKIIKQEECNNALKISNRNLLNCYDDIRSFRHDFRNIMQSIYGYITLRDWNGLEGMYNSINIELNEINELLKITSNKINNPGVCNLVNIKYQEAKKLGINMIIDSKIDFKKINISDYNLCRILGILLDNAIEATQKCAKKDILVKFVYDDLNKRYLVIVENPYEDEEIEFDKLFKKGVTSKIKKIDHGLGLWRVKKIIDFNKNLQIYTNRNKLFKQQLEIY